MRSGLVCDLPYPVYLDQIMEVDPYIRRYRGSVPDDLHRSTSPTCVTETIRPTTLPLGSVGYENKTDEQGQRLFWLDHAVVSRLRAMRGPGESYSDVILQSLLFFRFRRK
jgi:hypothetical protein